MPDLTVYPPTHPMPANVGDVLTADPSVPNGVSWQPPLRDAALQPQSGVWTPLVNAAISSTVLVTTTLNGLEMAVPFYVPIQTTFKAFELEVTAAGTTGAVLRIGVRKNNAGLPGAVLADAGTVSGTATGMQATATLGTPLTLKKGWYFYTVTPQGAPTTGASIRLLINGDQRFPIYITTPTANGAIWGYTQGGVTGALPATFTTSATVLVTSPIRVFAQGN